MLLEAIYHQSKSHYAYAYNPTTLHIRVRTKRNDMDNVYLIHGDKYKFQPDYINTTKMKKFASDTLFDYYHAEVKPPYRRFAYCFRFESGDEVMHYNEVGFQEEGFDSKEGIGMLDSPSGMFEFPFLNPIDVNTPPEWVKDAIFYQIFPERFGNGDPSLNPTNVEPWSEDVDPTPQNFFGGDLQGVIDHLDYLVELGINAIYFTPIFEATTNHKYDTIDYLKVDPHFGDNALAKKMVDEAHKRGIKIMLDAVFNHSGFFFPPFQDVLKHGEKSKYTDWFHLREFPVKTEPVPNYDAFAFVSHMPKLNTEHPEVKAYLLEVARYWIEDIGADGWRLDVANEVDHQFWREFRQVVKKANPEAYILGEVWHNSMPWLQGDQFDAVMNYPVTNSILEFFCKGSIDAQQFMGRLDQMQIAYPKQVNEVAFNLLDSHDTPRLLTIAGNDKNRMKLAATFQLTYMGSPCIYYGDEIGMDGGQDPGCRKPMVWEENKQDKDLFTFYQQLISLRKEHRALRDGSFQFLSAETGQRYVAYERSDDKDRFLIILNSDEKEQVITLTGVKDGAFRDVVANERYQVSGGTLEVNVPALSSLILKDQ
ncbi:alpha amylase N-terminal ig-like domain-containing protein [Evansella tamaricis]|uniref:Alpha amylase N-terminal ig-like domain-containing protein n=1 Tax=Evansella tamaricis TaxID=2069301 RepID=A0ABS6JGK9_9BACI|nr:alpha amylase N-terminal ig-like domain-containing protein [Evansella tamaricis]MBU9712799.1 alpha amylase N-terminal ig-like domain-containing protein [Evansella tamaricis]